MGQGTPVNPFKSQVPRAKVAGPILRESTRHSGDDRKPNKMEGHSEKSLKSRMLPQDRISKWPRKPGL